MTITAQLIEHINSFIPLEDKYVPHIQSCFETRHYAKKENLLEAGKLCKHHFFVGAGLIRMFFVNEKGVEQTTQFAMENWWITDHLAFQHRKKSDFFIQAIEPTEVLSIDLEGEQKLFDHVPTAERYFRLLYQKAYGASQRGMKFRYDLSGEQLYLNFKKSFPAFTKRVPQYLLASYLGITPEYLSEIKKRHT